MGIIISRKKKRNILLSIVYKLGNWLPYSHNAKLKLYLDLAWIFSRLAHEQTFRSSIKITNGFENDFLLDQIKDHDNILDIGCGEGHVMGLLLNKTSKIVGVDYNQASIDVAKEKFGSSVDLICDNVFNYLKENKNKTFEVIILSHVFEHIEQPNLFLKDLVPFGNYFYIEVPDFEATHLNLFRQKLNTDLLYSDADHVSEFDRAELAKIIIESGLSILKTEFRFGVMKFWCSSKK